MLDHPHLIHRRALRLKEVLRPSASDQCVLSRMITEGRHADGKGK